MRSRAIVLVFLIAASLMVASGVAWAATISCPNRDGNLCVGTDNRDTMTGRASADDMRARGGNDALNARGGNDKLDGGLGNDSLVESAGNDTYRFANGWGVDSLDGVGGGVDTLDFSAVSRRVSADLRQIAGSDEARSGQSFLNISNTDAIIENARGGTDGDNLLGNDFANVLVGNAGSDSLWGGAQGNDTLLGGPGSDSHEGLAGDDRQNGGEGNDYYFYQYPDWDKDTIIDKAVADDDLDTFNQVFVGPAVSGNLTINLASSTTTPELHYTGLPDGSDTVEWSNSVIDRVFSWGTGNDTISGNDSPNHISSRDGNDTISAGGGDDFIDVQDGATGDTVDCGGGDDTYKIDSGDEFNPFACENRGT